MSKTMYSLASHGLEASLVKIEVDHYGGGNPGTVIVGLGDTAVQESREPVRAAMKNSQFTFPRGRVVINLAPADLRKSGPVFDLPIALGLIALSHGIQYQHLESSVIFGELSLDGKITPVHGILSLVSVAKQMGFSRIYVPQANAAEAALIDGVTVYGLRSLQDAVTLLTGNTDPDAYQICSLRHSLAQSRKPVIDMADIRGQSQAKRALEIAAAGGHNILMNGSPGSGKTLMAKALPGILPPLTFPESLEVTQLYSLSGLLPKGKPMIFQRPFRVVHHTASGAALVGGGRVPMPGEISLAHRGVLFLDELAEFPSSVLELLRQPLEDRCITISRTLGSLSYPAQFMLCAAMNPCPCGYSGVPSGTRQCSCTAYMIQQYQKKISGPLFDRIDLYCAVAPVSYEDLDSTEEQEHSSDILARVQAARQIQFQRFEGSPFVINSEMDTPAIRRHCLLNSKLRELLQQAVDRFSLSARAYHRLLKVARTIADLRSAADIAEGDILEALQYRKAV